MVSGKGCLMRFLSACVCGGRKKKEKQVEDVEEHMEKAASPQAVMEPVLSMACHGTVRGQERKVFVAVKNYLHSSSVRVTQLARPCDVLLMFHDISGGVEVDTLLRKVREIAGESGALQVVLVLMYKDLSGNHLAGFQASGRQRLGEKCWRKLENAVSLLVDMVYNDQDEGLLDCLQNTYSLQQVVQYLKHVVRNQNAMLTVDSFSIARAVQHSTPVKQSRQNPQAVVPCALIPAGSFRKKFRTPSSSTNGSASQGSFHHTQSTQGSPHCFDSPHEPGQSCQQLLTKKANPVVQEKSLGSSSQQAMAGKRPSDRQLVRSTIQRTKTWGGWEDAKPSHGSTQCRNGRIASLAPGRPTKKHGVINSVSDQYSGAAAEEVMSACYRNKQHGTADRIKWHEVPPPVYDGNCFLEMEP